MEMAARGCVRCAARKRRDEARGCGRAGVSRAWAWDWARQGTAWSRRAGGRLQAAQESRGDEQPSSGGNGAGDISGQGESVSKRIRNLVGTLPDNFSIIESSETMKDFAKMDMNDIEANIASRRNQIFLHMEEIRRLRIQLRLKDKEATMGGIAKDEKFSSAIPLFPPITESTLKFYYTVYALAVPGLIVFGGLVAPVLEVRMGIGGLSYLDFIQSVSLPTQLALVDPIVASFVGGAVGVLSSLLIVEVNNVKEREKQKCFYCEGEGYLACGTCGGTGRVAGKPCSSCSGTGKVMCTTCLCTGRLMATEHDPRIDPFD